jgi:hypothetical protein
MLEIENTINRFLLQYARMLVTDIPDERLTEQPLSGVNHPAWILGHLAYSADRGVSLLGGEKALPAAWTPLFGPETTPTNLRSDYPTKGELLERLEKQFERFRHQASSATSEQLAQPSTNPYTKDALPTLKEAIAFLLTGHLAVHLGQLSTWRRMIGMPRLF